MKKTIFVLFAATMTLLLLASCAAAPSAFLSTETGGASQSWVADSVAASMDMPISAPTAPMERPEIEMDMSAPGYSAVFGDSGGTGLVPITPPVSDSSLAEKIIYTVSADIETLDYLQSVAMVHTLMARHGAFVESSFVGGVNLESTFFGWSNMRHARFTLRVPTDRLNTLTSDLESIGNVASLSSDAQNITQQFSDTTARLNTLSTQEQRLLELLAEAENVEDLLAIEDRLGWVRFEIEQLTSTVRNWQNQIDYSTVHITIREVEQFTVIDPPDERSYWQQIGDGFIETTRGIAHFFMNLFRWILVSLPVLILLAAIAVVTILIIKRRIRKNREQRGS